ncbi:hypothetical protein D3C76_1609770 [compost metagenome]
MGAQELAHLCGQLEECAKQPSLNGLEDLLGSIEREVIIVRQLYSEERERFAAHPVR